MGLGTSRDNYRGYDVRLGLHNRNAVINRPGYDCLLDSNILHFLLITSHFGIIKFDTRRPTKLSLESISDCSVLFCSVLLQNANASSKTEFIKDKAFLLVHGTADGRKVEFPSLFIKSRIPLSLFSLIL